MRRSVRLLNASLQSGNAGKCSSRLAGNLAVSVLHQDDINNRFYIEINSDKATVDYEQIDSKTLDLLHTNVPSSLQGKGIGKIIAKEVFEYCKANDLKMKLTCDFLQKFYEDNKSNYNNVST